MHPSTKQTGDIHIVDIRRIGDDDTLANASIRDEIGRGLDAPFNLKTLPTMLLYDERGLRLYDKITTDAPEYYPFSAEEEILREHAYDIVQLMHGRTDGIVHDEVVVELGAGSLRKTSHILRAASELVPKPSPIPPVTYFALDLEERELRRTLTELNMSEIGSALAGKVETMGLLGTYDSGLRFITDGGLPTFDEEEEEFHSPIQDREMSTRARNASSSSSDSTTAESDLTSPSSPAQPPVHLMFLGSSLGNFEPGEDAQFLRSFPLRPGSGDTLLLGLSHHTNPEDIEVAYNDPGGHTREFIMNGLKAAGNALGDPHLFDLDNWEYVNKYNEAERVHEAYYKCIRPHQIRIPQSNKGVQFLDGELVKIEISRKAGAYSESDIFRLFSKAQLRSILRWIDSTGRHSLFLLERPPFMFPLLPAPTADSDACGPLSVPSTDDWHDIWAAWDFVTLRMIPHTMLHQKPIDLRHICLFYLGHVPTFMDIHLSKLLKEPNTEPEEFKYIFERGIDPNVDDPTKCHDHSEVPQNDEDWPSLESILSFRLRARERLLKLYADISSGKIPMTRSVARVLFMTYEHEGLHLEVRVPSQRLVDDDSPALGCETSDTLLYMLIQRAGTGTIPPPDFSPPVWRSLAESWKHTSKPVSDTVVVDATTVTIGIDDIESEDEDPVKSHDVAGHTFGWDNESPKREVAVDAFRIAWRPITNGEFYEFYRRTVEGGNAGLGGAKEGKLAFPASWVMTDDGEIEVRTLYGPIPIRVAWDWPVLTSYNNLSVYARVKGGRIPTEPELRVFLDKFESGYEGGANTGFRNWHPVPATMGLDIDGGKGHNGGVWEWTSTVLDKHEGFVASSRYPGYTADFFDGAHNVVLGGSYATIPRIAERRSFRNWYQRNYPYAWIGARVVYDLE
ncbi:hypothetical protein EDC04DRAFT_2903331 [Pisolithus marmoratus]|nr:hypothetical protein EDC04DRAFT_2903331 [Pisolithus marmoratus]